MSSDRSWRRVAFRVQDYVTPNATVRIRMIASDSTRAGEYLDGGSLVEAAVDDIQLWQNNGNIGIGESAVVTFTSVHPNPANDMLNVSIALEGAKGLRWQVIDATGRLAIDRFVGERTGDVRDRLDVSVLAEGAYVLRATWTGGTAEQRFTVVR